MRQRGNPGREIQSGRQSQEHELNAHHEDCAGERKGDQGRSHESARKGKGPAMIEPGGDRTGKEKPKAIACGHVKENRAGLSVAPAHFFLNHRQEGTHDDPGDKSQIEY